MLFFTPVTMVCEKKVSNVKLGNFVDRLYRSKRLSSSQADNPKCQYYDLLQCAVLQFVLCTKKSFQVLITSLIELMSFQVSLSKKIKGLVIYGLHVYLYLCWLMAKVVCLISTRQCWLRAWQKPLLKDRDYFSMWHQKIKNVTIHQFIISR